MENKNTKEKELFNRLVENGLDFIGTSITNLENGKLKYSIIHFCSGLEILLKARLLQEHWTLIVQQKNMHFNNLKNGDSSTIGIKQAIDLLETVLEMRVPELAREAFEKIRKHRNSSIHFYSSKEDKEIQEIIIEQLRAWFYLHRMLTNDWDEIFSEYDTEIERLNCSLHNNRQYLAEKFELIRNRELLWKHKAGETIITCKFCEFEAGVIHENNYPRPKCVCLVCETEYFTPHRVICPLCEKVNYFLEDATRTDLTCEGCEHQFTLSNLAEQEFEIERLVDLGFTKSEITKEQCFSTDSVLNAFAEAQYDLYQPTTGYCSTCEYIYPSVIKLDEEYICVECLETYDAISQCDWCGEPIARIFSPDGFLMEEFATGCHLDGCQGAIGYQLSKND